MLGFENYLFVFSVFKIRTLELDKRKKEYVYFSKLFKKNSNILVLGANTGITTVPVALNVAPGKVIAIEPVPENFRTLKKIVQYFKCSNVSLMNFALGNDNKEIEMYLPVINDTKSHGLAYVKDQNIEGFDEGIEYKVMMKKLDSIDEIINLKVDGIKIVAENYEKNIFEGGKEIIMKNRPLIYCELWFNENRNKVLELIKSWNYEIRVLQDNKLISLDSSVHKTKNLFFIPLEKLSDMKDKLI